MIRVTDLKKLRPAGMGRELKDALKDFPYDKDMTDEEFHQTLQDFMFPLVSIGEALGFLKANRGGGREGPTLYGTWGVAQADRALAKSFEGAEDDGDVWDLKVTTLANEAAHRLFGPSSNVHYAADTEKKAAAEAFDGPDTVGGPAAEDHE